MGAGLGEREKRERCCRCPLKAPVATQTPVNRVWRHGRARGRGGAGRGGGGGLRTSSSLSGVRRGAWLERWGRERSNGGGPGREGRRAGRRAGTERLATGAAEMGWPWAGEAQTGARDGTGRDRLYAAAGTLPSSARDPGIRLADRRRAPGPPPAAACGKRRRGCAAKHRPARPVWQLGCSHAAARARRALLGSPPAAGLGGFAGLAAGSRRPRQVGKKKKPFCAGGRGRDSTRAALAKSVGARMMGNGQRGGGGGGGAEGEPQRRRRRGSVAKPCPRGRKRPFVPRRREGSADSPWLQKSRQAEAELLRARRLNQLS